MLVLVIPKSWCFTVLIEAHDKLGHQGVTRTYHLIKQQYFWKGMNKDICKYIANCTLCKRKKAKMQMYPLQQMDIPNQPFDKIAINLIMDLKWLHIRESAHSYHYQPSQGLSRKKVNIIIHVFINNYLPVHICPWYMLSNNGIELKNQPMDNILQFGINHIFPVPYNS